MGSAVGAVALLAKRKPRRRKNATLDCNLWTQTDGGDSGAIRRATNRSLSKRRHVGAPHLKRGTVAALRGKGRRVWGENLGIQNAPFSG